MSTDPAAREAIRIMARQINAKGHLQPSTGGQNYDWQQNVLDVLDAAEPPPSPAQSAGSKEELKKCGKCQTPYISARHPNYCEKCGEVTAPQPATEQERGEKPMPWPKPLTPLIGRKITATYPNTENGVTTCTDVCLGTFEKYPSTLRMSNKDDEGWDTGFRTLVKVEEVSPPPETVKQAEGIKRYDIHWRPGGLLKATVGPRSEWVKYLDHATHVAALESELRKVREERDALGAEAEDARKERAKGGGE